VEVKELQLGSEGEALVIVLAFLVLISFNFWFIAMVARAYWRSVAKAPLN